MNRAITTPTYNASNAGALEILIFVLLIALVIALGAQVSQIASDAIHESNSVASTSVISDDAAAQGVAQISSDDDLCYSRCSLRR